MKANLTASFPGGLPRNVSAFWMMAVILALGVCGTALGDDEDMYTTTAGSGARYETTIERTAQGEMEQEDLRQATILSSRVGGCFPLGSKEIGFRIRGMEI